MVLIYFIIQASKFHSAFDIFLIVKEFKYREKSIGQMSVSIAGEWWARKELAEKNLLIKILNKETLMMNVVFKAML